MIHGSPRPPVELLRVPPHPPGVKHEHDLVVLRVLDPEGDVRATRPLQPLPGRRRPRFGRQLRLVPPGEALVDQRVDQRVLVGEVQVDAAHAAADAPGDVAHAHLAVAGDDQQVTGGLEDGGTEVDHRSTAGVGTPGARGSALGRRRPEPVGVALSFAHVVIPWLAAGCAGERWVGRRACRLDARARGVAERAASPRFIGRSQLARPLAGLDRPRSVIRPRPPDQQEPRTASDRVAGCRRATTGPTE